MFGVGNRQGICIVLSSPSGAGKTTISRKILDSDKNLSMSISCTTRAPRPGEVDGKDYYFVSKDKFKDMINNGEFLEHAEVFGNFYGTPVKHVKDKLAAGHDVVFDIDWQGTAQLKEKIREEIVTIFILPPSMAELEKRLRQRAQDTDDVVQKRMLKASNEINHWDEYRYVLVNDNLEHTIDQVESIIKAERLHSKRYPGMQKFVQNLLFGE